MGTNYYLHEKEAPAPTLATVNEGLHICKISAGWMPHFQAYPLVRTYKSVMAFIQTGDIYNEYGEYIPYSKFKEIIETHTGKLQPDNSTYKTFSDSGYNFTETPFS